MKIIRERIEIEVIEFDYTVTETVEKNIRRPKIYNIYVYGDYGEQYDYANVYDIQTLRKICLHLVHNGLQLKSVRDKEIEDVLLPFPDDDELDFPYKKIVNYYRVIYNPPEASLFETYSDYFYAETGEDAIAQCLQKHPDSMIRYSEKVSLE